MKVIGMVGLSEEQVAAVQKDVEKIRPGGNGVIVSFGSLRNRDLVINCRSRLAGKSLEGRAGPFPP